jgi:predicted Zn finger-like uncharacterized protein
VEELTHAGAAGNPTMDVQCERCKTEYEFDDALVSGRGTTVRCTTCGHQFKVRRAEGGDASGDRWLVKTANGHQFTFVTLRELQRAILAHQVSKGDLLRRAGAPPRPLGSISELEPFFEGRATSTRPPPPGPADDGPELPAAFPKRSSITWETESPAVPPLPRSNTASYGQAPPEMRRKIDTLRPPLGAGAPPQAAPIVPQPVVSTTPYPGAPVPFHEATTAVERIEDVRQPAPSNLPEMSSPLPAPTRPVRRGTSSGEFGPSEMRSSLPPSIEEPYSMRRGRRVGGWIVALVLLLAVGVLGWAIARPYIVARSASASAQLDPRAEAFLVEGEKAMGEGNLEQAREAFDKASALAESDPRVALDQARVATAQADVPWLKLKLLPASSVDEVRTTKADMNERVARAGRLADAALASAPDAPAAARVKLDALRLAGQQDAARGLVAKVIAQASQPETAYVLAALDLAEPEPLWTTLLERLRVAAAGEGGAGRARAALVYSLAKSGDAAGARTELGKLDALARPYPLSPDLHLLVDRASSKGLDAGAEAPSLRGPSPPAVGVNAAPAATAPAAAPPAAAPVAAGDSIPGDSRSAMQTASQAYKKGDFARARQIYEAIVTRNPSDSEAVAALGDVARAEGNSAGAIASYKRAIAVNPSYLPALLGLADTQWASGDRAGATRGYSDIADRFPEGTYPAYVKQRVEGASAAPAAPPADTTKSAAPASSDESSP